MSILVELMAKEMFLKLMINPYWIEIQHNTAICTGISEYLAKDALSVVKKHIGEVAEVCPDCLGCGEGLEEKTHEYHTCDLCRGSGIIARTDGGSNLP